MDTAELAVVIQIRLIGFGNLACNPEKGAMKYHVHIWSAGLKTGLEI